MRCISVIGPSQSGKTRLVERLAGLGSDPVTAAIGAGLGLTRFAFGDEGWGVIDCPGSIEALPDIGYALLASDAAVICVGPEPEEAVLAAPFLRAAEASGTPALLFINRMDEARARVREIAGALQDYSNHAIVLRQIPIRSEGRITGAVDLISERAWKYREGQPSALIEIPDSAREREHEARAGLLEELSEHDDWLLEELIEEREPAAGPLYALCTRALRENTVIPAFLGSAEHGNGILRLMKALRHEVPDAAALAARLAAALGAEGGAEPLRAVGFHADHRKHVGKVLYLRALGDGVRAGAPLGGSTLGSFADAGAPTSGPLEPGGIAGAVKSDHLHAGRVFTAGRALGPPPVAVAAMPMIARVLTPLRERDEAKLSTTLARLAEDEPGLAVSRESGTGRPVVHVQGMVHLRALRERLSEIFGIEVAEHPVGAEYRETITRRAETHYRHRKQTGGAGQFADVRLTVAPNARGEGFSFDQTVKGGAVPKNHIPAVEAGARDAMERGPLGLPVLDVHVTLTDGQHHSVDSSDFAFRTAARHGTAEAMAAAAPVLLQPIHRVVFHVPSLYSGALVPLVSSLRGQVLGFERDPDARGWDAFRALLPGSALPDLAQALRTATQGTGHYEERFDHFEEIYGKDAERALAAAQEHAEAARAHAGR